MAFLITTTDTLPGGQLVIPEFGDRTLVQPLVNYDLELEFDIDEKDRGFTQNMVGAEIIIPNMLHYQEYYRLW